MRHLMNLLEQDTFTRTDDGRLVRNTPDAEYVWNDQWKGWTINMLKGDKGILSRRIWQAVTGTRLPRFGIAPSDKGPLVFDEKADAEAAVKAMMAGYERQGYTI